MRGSSGCNQSDRPGIRKLAKQFNVGTGTVHRMARLDAGPLAGMAQV